VQLTYRPAPSAGARHPCELLVAAVDVLDLPPGWWLFDSTRCELVSQELPGLEAASAAEEAGVVLGVDHPLPAVVFLIANLSRTLSRYPAGTSLVWRDAGVLLGLLHLCACDLGLGSCIAGMSGALPLDFPLVDVGAMALGTLVN
jgi:SagB-type dehydrogenase family enzyme